MSGLANRGYLLLRRGGVLWAIDNAAVGSLTRRDGAYRISLGTGDLNADEILCVVQDLQIRPLAPAVRRFWPEASAGAAGMAVHGELPLVIVDPRQPPSLLFEGDAIDERE